MNSNLNQNESERREGAALLDALSAVLRRLIVFPTSAASVVIALWIVHTRLPVRAGDAVPARAQSCPAVREVDVVRRSRLPRRQPCRWRELHARGAVSRDP